MQYGDIEREQFTIGGESQKFTVKLTEKAFPEKLDKLQTLRKLKLNKAGNIRTKMNDFIFNGDKKVF